MFNIKKKKIPRCMFPCGYILFLSHSPLLFFFFFLQHSSLNEHFNQFSSSDIMSHNNLTEERERNKHLQKVLNLEDGWEYVLINVPSQQLFYFASTQCCHFGNITYKLFEMSKHLKMLNAKLCLENMFKSRVVFIFLNKCKILFFCLQVFNM